MIEFLAQLIKEYSLKAKNTEDSVITVERIEDELIKCRDFDKFNKVMTSILQEKRRLYLSSLLNDEYFKKHIEDILSIEGTRIENFWLIYTGYIPIEIIEENNSYHLLSDFKKAKLKELGYGINKFKIEISTKIKQVYCYGKHPNINPDSLKFCFYDLDIPLNKIGFLSILDSLSKCNINKSYLNMGEYHKLGEILNEKIK